MKFKDYIILALIAIGLFLWWRGCHPAKVTPVQVTIKELIHDTVVNSAALKHTADSFNRVLHVKQAENDLMYKDFTILLNENQVLQNENILLNQPVPDTCKALDKAWQDKYSNFARQTGRTTVAASRTIDGLKSTVATQQGFMKAKDMALVQTKRSLADCIATAKQYEKMKPKRELSLGISGLLNYGLSEAAAGVVAGYRSPKGWSFDVGVYTNKVGMVSVKKSLVRW